jgi:putative CocE/NonD family hydrolase
MNQLPNRSTQQPGQSEFGSYVGEMPRYSGHEVQSLYLTMRDGVDLAVDVVLPLGLLSGVRIPAILEQTRYWRAMELRAPFKWLLKPEVLNPDFKDFQPFFVSRGYALVLVDVRGTGASFGTWPHPWSEESVEDAREIVDWIVAQPWSNGKVGGMGVSYVGTTAELLVASNHPAVKAVMPMFNHPDAYTDIAFPGGVLNERFIRDWGHFDQVLDQNRAPREFGFLGPVLVKGVKPVDGEGGRLRLAEAAAAHAANGDVYTLARLVTYRDQRQTDGDICVDDLAVHRYKEAIEQSDAAIFGWGSWLDAGTADAVLRRFLTFEHAQRAVIGAWEHGGRFNASPYRISDRPPNPSLPAQWGEALRFFDAHLKGVDNGVRSEKVLFYYTMGEEKWKRTKVWPPKGTMSRRWYLAAQGALSVDRPVVETGADTYQVDLEASTGGTNRWWEMGGIFDHSVTYGDRAAAARHLLTYTSPPLEDDTEITGYPVVTLHLSSTESDGVVYAYLEDVDEASRVTYVTEGQLRVIHRKVSDEPSLYRLQVPYHSFKEADAQPLVPGEMAEISFGLLPTSVRIRKGHRVRLSIAGHDAGTFVRIPGQGTPVLTIARNRIYASHLDLPVVAGPGQDSGIAGTMGAP